MQSSKPTVIDLQQEEKKPPAFEYHQGIIPHPDLMKGYGEADPDFPKQIMGWTSDMLVHEREMQKRALRFTFVERLLNNIFGIIAVCILVGGGVWFMLEGYPTAGASIICTTVAATAGIFVLRSTASKKQPKSNLPEKK